MRYEARCELESEVLTRIHRRVSLACLDAAIMKCVATDVTLDACEIITILRNDYLKQLSPGTVYPVLYKLEREGIIKKLVIPPKMSYALSKKGNSALRSVEVNVDNLQQVFKFIKRP